MSSEYIGINEARPILGDIITRVQQGADVVLTRNGKPAARLARYEEVAVFTVEIQAGNADGTIWQALAPAEGLEATSAEDAGEWTAQNQNVADGPNWRICVWDGDDADTGTEPTYIWEPEIVA